PWTFEAVPNYLSFTVDSLRFLGGWIATTGSFSRAALLALLIVKGKLYYDLVSPSLWNLFLKLNCFD
ncbi:MAG: hypothetical protein ACKO96_39015, partial [Flammeovirgaceae bacterium]